ncbi:Alpha/Beta hydrolase protein [Vararia minispora EC-137]|uniref:Alpha/Beta hydrolase protein n=1 Tax=Vararia minispora EC-137 TaxID=1314806 RepID=A0ACB8QWH6_9AGAM|nr:Alpha/Beta hydrolase protein [Vararia minispora EC-137]
MQGVWIPVPVSLLFRRVVNVLSSLSLAHQVVFRRDDVLPSVDPVSIPWPRIRWPTELFSLEPEQSSSSPLPPPPSGPSNSNSSPRPNPAPRPPDPTQSPPEDTRTDPIHVLMRSPALYDPVRTPRFPIVLCHGLYGFDVRGPAAIPALRMHYWADVSAILRRTVGAEVIVAAVPSTGSIADRAVELDRSLRARARGRGVNLLAHSMGGLDGRHLITHIRPHAYVPLSLTSIATPHRGSPFMDWCTDYLGLGRTDVEREKRRLAARAARNGGDDEETEYARVDAEIPDTAPAPSSSSSTAASGLLASLPTSFTALLMSMFDSPAYANLTTAYLRDVFNPSTPDDPNVRYFSVGARAGPLSVWHPLWFPKLVVDGAEERERTTRAPSSSSAEDVWGNDGLVTLRSARWGEYLGTLEGTDHWRVRGEAGTQLGAQLPELVSREWARVARALRRSVDEADERVGSGRAAATRDSEERERVRAEALRSSTARLSAVVDWLVEQVPAPSRTRDKGEREKSERSKADLKEHEDLERFYVALAKRIWDAGL